MVFRKNVFVTVHAYDGVASKWHLRCTCYSITFNVLGLQLCNTCVNVLGQITHAGVQLPCVAELVHTLMYVPSLMKKARVRDCLQST